MSLLDLQHATPTTLPNAISRYHDEIVDVLAQDANAANTAFGPRNPPFNPGWRIPDRAPALEQFFEPSTIRWAPLAREGDVNLSVLDMCSNPATRTTKTNPSLLMVARAVHHIRTVGERIVIVTPSSANKATALRDAVLRAITCGLVTPDELSIVCIVPSAARGKLWRSDLAATAELAARNPVLVHHGPQRDGVKELAKSLQQFKAEQIERRTGSRLWFTLDLANYRTADVLRFFFEEDWIPPAAQRLHAHSVSSAFGLLGHAHGARHRRHEDHSGGYFLVQHLDTPDMVLGLYRGSFDRKGLPAYTRRATDGLFHQVEDPHFPYLTHDPDEVLDPTFYTHQPATQAQMGELIRTHGGGGIVVSLHECLSKYPQIRHTLQDADIVLPSDPRKLREWSLVMAMTGVLNGIERSLIPAGSDVVVHATGSYSTDDYDPIPDSALITHGGTNELAETVERVASY